MSNPTLLVASFENDSGDFVVTGPERYDGGLWLEEGTTNHAVNPSFEAGITLWNAWGTSTRSHDTGEGFDGSASMELINGAANSGTQNGVNVVAASGDVWTTSAYVKGTGTFQIGWWGRNGGATIGSASFDAGIALTAAFERHIRTATISGASLNNFFSQFRNTSNGVTWNLDAVQIENKPYATSFARSDMGAGYSTTPGPGGNDLHVRAASSASISPSGILAPGSGSLAFRFRRLIDTGGVEPIIDCGDGTSGKDRLRVRITASDKLELSWQTNGGAQRTIQSTESISVNTDYLIYVGWNGIHVELSIDNGTKVTGTRDAPAGDWGAAPLTLKAE